MPVAPTRTVSGFVTNLSAEEIDGAQLHFDIDPGFVFVGDTVVIGEQSGGVPGELITPLADDGSWSIDIVAVPHQVWTISVTVDGPNIEDPKPKFVIRPPLDDSEDPIGVGDLAVSQSCGVALPKLVTLADVRVTNLTDGDGFFYDAVTGFIVNRQPSGGSGGGGSLPSGGKAGDFLVKGSETDSDATWRTPSVSNITGAMPLASADDSGKLAVITSGGAVIGSDLAAADVSSSLEDIGANKAPATGVLSYARAADGSWPAHPDDVLVQWIETNASTPEVPPGMVNGDVYVGPSGMTGLPAGGTP